MLRIILALLVVSPVASAEMYKWTDSQGRVHFSDKAPTHTRAQSLEKPKPVGNEAVRANAPESSADVVERQRKALRVIQEERAEREAKAQQEAQKKAEHKNKCNEARHERSKLDGGRIYTLDKNGKPVFLSDDQIQAEREKYDKALRKHC